MGERIADRLHVSATGREVVAAVRAAMLSEVRRAVRFRADRHAVYRRALARHAENRDLCARWR